MTMRAAWWVLKLVARVATRAGRWLRVAWQDGAAGVQIFDEMAGRLDVDEPRPRANLADFLDGSADADAAHLELVKAYGRTFCGACGAKPTGLSKRCPACLQLLAKVLGELHGDEPKKLAEIARLAREWSL